MELGRFICSLGPCINRRTFGKHGCLKCEKDFALNDFDQKMRGFRDTNSEDKIEKNLIGSRICFSIYPNEDAAELKEEKKWSHIVAKTIGPHNKAAWMITTTSDSSHQSFEKITNPSKLSKGPQSALNQTAERHDNHIERNTELNDTPHPQYFELE